MKKKIILALLLLLMFLIFCFSAQPSDDSTETSSHVCKILANLMFSDFSSYNISVQNIITDGLSHIVRKTAHFTEYACMGFLFYFYFSDKKSRCLLSVLGVALYASSDEMHQLFINGRSGQVTDVLLDTCGGICGAFLAFVLLCIYDYLVHHQKQLAKT